MEGFIDIHTHILPGVDDGAKDMPEAMDLAQMAYDNGTRTLFLTPHYRAGYKENSPAWLRESFSMFRQMLEQTLPDMQLVLGSEAQYESQLPELLEEGTVLPLGESRCVLLEFPYNALRSSIFDGVMAMSYSGFVPVIAHVERYAAFRKDESLLDAALNMGALIQLNAQSVMGGCGWSVKQYCHRLLKEEKAHFIASDAHDVKHRPPLLKKCFQYVAKKYSPEYAQRLFRENAQTVLSDGKYAL